MPSKEVIVNFIDGFETLVFASFQPEERQIINLVDNNGTSIEHTFMVPYLSDGVDNEIILPDPNQPERVHYLLSA